MCAGTVGREARSGPPRMVAFVASCWEGKSPNRIRSDRLCKDHGVVNASAAILVSLRNRVEWSWEYSKLETLVSIGKVRGQGESDQASSRHPELVINRVQTQGLVGAVYLSHDPVIPYLTSQRRWSQTTTSSTTTSGPKLSPPHTVTAFNILGPPAVELPSWLIARSVISLHTGSNPPFIQSVCT